MAFGIDAGISRTTAHSVQVAEQDGATGKITAMHTYGGKQTKTEESFSTSYTNAATNGQTGTAIVTEHTLTESNKDYAKESKTTVTALAVP